MKTNRFHTVRTHLLFIIATIEQEDVSYFDYNTLLDSLPRDLDMCMIPNLLFFMTGINYKCEIVSCTLRVNSVSSIASSRTLKITKA